MSLVEVLFRDSLEADGVLSRGADWHPRASRQDLGGLTTGDVVRVTTEIPDLYIMDGTEPRILPKWGRAWWLPEVTNLPALVRRQTEDGWRLWQSAPSASWLLRLAYEARVAKGFLLRAAIECAATAIRHLPPGEPAPARALVYARRWCAGVAGLGGLEQQSAVLRACTRIAASGFSGGGLARVVRPLNSCHAMAEVTSVVVIDSKHAAEVAWRVAHIQSANAKIQRVQQSLSFLVRATLPAWVVLLGLARREGGAR